MFAETRVIPFKSGATVAFTRSLLDLGRQPQRDCMTDRLLSPSEFGLINWIRQRPGGWTSMGIGDDCAILRVASSAELLVTTDMLMDARRWHSPVRSKRAPRQSLAEGIDAYFSICDRPSDLDEAKSQASVLSQRATEQVMRAFLAGSRHKG